MNKGKMSSRVLRSKKGSKGNIEEVVKEENGKEDVKSPQAEDGKIPQAEDVKNPQAEDGKSPQTEVGNLDTSSDFKNNDSEKRTAEECDLPPIKRQKIRDSTCKQAKNAISQLNELKYDAKYVFDSESGPAHSPTFVCSAIISEKQFIGKGSSKKLAKHAAAEAALKSFIQVRDSSKTFTAPSSETSAIDFTDDNVGNTDFIQCQLSENINESIFVRSKMDKKLRKLNAETHKKGPLVLLNEICPGLPFLVVDENPTCQDQRFVMNVTVDGIVFEGVGPTKKAAKVAVAQKVLSEKYNLDFSLSLSEPMELISKDSEFSQELADKMAELVHSTMSKLATENKKCPKWETLASVVLTTDQAMEDMMVISLATGSGSLNGENISLIGAVLTDCHAEVLARRCLKDFLFTQLEFHTTDKPNKSIFDKIDGKFKLKPNHKFHFYSTTAPCGTAQEEKCRTLRTKLESGCGTVKIESKKIEQNAEDIMAKRARYQVMSCSDKFTIWNALGIQGSLLNYFIEPVYFHAIVLGQPCQLSHIAYSMFSRIESSLEPLPLPFSLHKPQIAASSATDQTKTTDKPSEDPQKISMNWTYGLNKPELLVANTGKPTTGHISRLAKRSVFQRFSNLYNIFLKTPALSHFYDSVKKASPDYQQAKGIVLKAFVSCGLGIWKKKPKEQDAFELLF